jgi:hypothetical protein
MDINSRVTPTCCVGVSGHPSSNLSVVRCDGHLDYADGVDIGAGHNRNRYLFGSCTVRVTW